MHDHRARLGLGQSCCIFAVIEAETDILAGRHRQRGDAMQHQPPGRGFGPFSIDPGRIDDRRQGVRTDAAEETRITRQRRTVPAERQRSGRHGYCF